jgi:hypothetical protein
MGIFWLASAPGPRRPRYIPRHRRRRRLDGLGAACVTILGAVSAALAAGIMPIPGGRL